VKRVSALHNILAQKVFRVSAGAMVMAVSGLLLAASSPASAIDSVTICESYGAYCVGAPSLGLYDQVVETFSGRQIATIGLGNNNWEFAFRADPTKCVAASNSGDVAVIHPCNGGSGIVWKAQVGPDGVSCIFENQHFSGKYLSGDDKGDQFHLKSKGASGWFQQFHPSSFVIPNCE
jgi:hypothetical protein